MQDTLFHARQPILPNEENRQTKIMSSNTRLPSYVHTAIILFVLCVICTTLLAAAATTKSGAWNAYTRDFGAECKAKQNRIVEQYRCEEFQNCCKMNADSVRHMCQTSEIIDCKTYECKWSNCTEMTTQAPHTGSANAPISKYFTIGRQNCTKYGSYYFSNGICNHHVACRLSINVQQTQTMNLCKQDENVSKLSLATYFHKYNVTVEF